MSNNKTPKVEETKWDLIIDANDQFIKLNFKELWDYRDLLWLWVRREYVGVYKQTILGPFWHFLSPIFGTVIFILVFGKIAKIPTDGIPMFLFYNAGLAAWNFFNGCFTSSSNAFISNAGIFGKVYFPRLIIPLASIISSLIKFGIQFGLFILFFVYFVIAKNYHPVIGIGLLLLPLCLLIFSGIGFGFGILISAITTKYRDLNILVGFIIQLLMYATPIIYPLSSVAYPLKKYLLINPLAAPMEAFKYALFGNGDFSIQSLFYSIGCMLILIFIGIISFNRAEKNFMDTI